MGTVEESPVIIHGYPNFEWIPENPITNGYENKYIIVKATDDKSE